MLIKWTKTALASVDEIAGLIAIYRVRGDDVEILRLHHAARNL